jgi:hypothetical protein
MCICPQVWSQISFEILIGIWRFFPLPNTLSCYRFFYQKPNPSIFLEVEGDIEEMKLFINHNLNELTLVSSFLTQQNQQYHRALCFRWVHQHTWTHTSCYFCCLLMVLRWWRQTILLAVVMEAVGKPRDEGVMSTTTSFPSVRNQCLIDQ